MTRGVDGASGEVVDELVHDGHGNRMRERRGDDTVGYTYDAANPWCTAPGASTGSTTPTAT